MKSFNIFYDNGNIKAIIFIEGGKIISARGFLENGKETVVEKIEEHEFKLSGQKYIQTINLIQPDDSFFTVELSKEINALLGNIKTTAMDKMLLYRSLEFEKFKYAQLQESIRQSIRAMSRFGEAARNLNLDYIP